jgi:hypothetical protein
MSTSQSEIKKEPSLLASILRASSLEREPLISIMDQQQMSQLRNNCLQSKKWEVKKSKRRGQTDRTATKIRWKWRITEKVLSSRSSLRTRRENRSHAHKDLELTNVQL